MLVLKRIIVTCILSACSVNHFRTRVNTSLTTCCFSLKKRKRTITYVIWFGCFFLKSTTRRRRCHGCRHVPHVRHVARYIVCCCWLEHTDDRHANVDTQWIDNAETQETNVSQNPSLRTADWHMVSWEEWNKY